MAEAAPGPRSMRPLEKALAVSVILGSMALCSIEGLPVLGQFHQRLKDAINPLLNVTGTWTGIWALYAPNVDKTNTRVTAEIFFSDGSRASWSQPNWPALSGWQRFVRFKHMEYYDNVRLDSNRGVWPGLARTIAREEEAKRASGGDGARVVRVELTRWWADIPPPGPGGAPPGPYVNFANSYKFYIWEPR